MRDAVHTDILFQQNHSLPKNPIRGLNTLKGCPVSPALLRSCLVLGQCRSGTSGQAAWRRAA